MAKLNYTYDEMMADYPYVKPHVVMGEKLHGGFDANGKYISPRMQGRGPAIEAWSQDVLANGGELIDVSVKLLKRDNYPNHQQQKFLLNLGLGKTLWDSLSIAGEIEGRGKVLSDSDGPNFQDIIVEDVSNTAIGHLNKGLHHAHGRDEGGLDGSDIGAHDKMWYVVRDLLFGKNAYPIPTAPDNITRPEGMRLFPKLPEQHEAFLLIYMNILMVEVRAEKMFAFCCSLFRDPDLFKDRRAAAEEAAVLVERIRQDEASHVGYLRAVLSEMRLLTFKLNDGTTVKGSDMLDPVWKGMVDFHSTTVYDNSRKVTRESIIKQLMALPDGEALVRQLDALETPLAAAAE